MTLRRIVGVNAMVLGAAAGVQTLRVATMFGWQMSQAEWIRFTFWLWVGGTLVVTGVWLWFRWRIAGWMALLSIPGFFAVVWIGHQLGLFARLASASG